MADGEINIDSLIQRLLEGETDMEQGRGCPVSCLLLYLLYVRSMHSLSPRPNSAEEILTHFPKRELNYVNAVS